MGPRAPLRSPHPSLLGSRRGNVRSMTHRTSEPRSFNTPVGTLLLITGLSLFFFLAALIRHWSFHSEAFDLGIFDQSLWLLSRGLEPFSTINDRHLLGDHGAWVLYGVAALYWIYPSVLWLFGLQAAALGWGAWLTFRIARLEGASVDGASLAAAALLLHPIAFNGQLYDFHPDVFAVPLLLLAYYAARVRRPLLFGIAILLTMGCKEVFAGTVAAFGLYMFLSRRAPRYGVAALLSALLVGSLTILWLIPTASGGQYSSGFERYKELADSPLELLLLLLTSPRLLFDALHVRETALYVALLLGPIAFSLHPKNLIPLVAAIPALTLNSLSEYWVQRSITFHYSLILLPLLTLVVVRAVSSRRDGGVSSVPTRRRVAYGWLFGWLLLPMVFAWSRGRFDYPHRWLPIDHWQQNAALHEAVAMIPDEAKVLAPTFVVPHLSQRAQIRRLYEMHHDLRLSEFNYIVVTTGERLGWLNTGSHVQKVLDDLEQSVQLGKADRLVARDDVRLYRILSHREQQRRRRMQRDR